MNTLHQMNESQTMMVDALARYLRERYPFEAHARIMKSEDGFAASLWRGFAGDLGILGAALPESSGGLGGNAVDHQLILEQLGQALAGEPYLSTAVIGGGFLTQSDGAAASALLEQVIVGEAVMAFAYAEPQGRYTLADLRTTLQRDGAGYVLNGHKAVVRCAPWATHFIVTARSGGAQCDAQGVSVALVPAGAPGIRRRDYPSVDGGRASEVYFDNVRIGADAVLREGDALPLIEQVVDDATIALCAEGVGVMRRLYRDTVDYARERKQFGVPISSFQVMQHRMADMLMHLEKAAAITQLTLGKFDGTAVTRARAVSSAKVTVAKACRFVGQNAVQIHGGMGMTDELAIGHFFKRATVVESMFGTVDHHLRRHDRLGHAAQEENHA
jgi:alkylation response protein AidB-like acyl-CoA dehydrogenase